MKIEKLEIKSRNVGEQFRFYRDDLGLEINNYCEESFEVTVGYSVIKFVRDLNSTPYHIAIHIPGKQEKEALDWIKEKVPVLKSNNEEIIDFSNWSAYSLYFYDADENIMEFISRRKLFKPEKAIFSEESFLGIAEVGLATSNIKEKFEFLNGKCRLKKYDGSLDKFCAIGDDEGLLITINKNEKDWFPTNSKAYSSSFLISFVHNGQSHHLKFENDKLIVLQESF